MFALWHRAKICSNCRSNKVERCIPTNLHKVYYCRDCGAEFRRLRTGTCAAFGFFILMLVLLALLASIFGLNAHEAVSAGTPTSELAPHSLGLTVGAGLRLAVRKPFAGSAFQNGSVTAVSIADTASLFSSIKMYLRLRGTRAATWPNSPRLHRWFAETQAASHPVSKSCALPRTAG